MTFRADAKQVLLGKFRIKYIMEKYREEIITTLKYSALKFKF